MRAGLELRELDAAGFRAGLDGLLAVYAAAMHAAPLLLPGRRSIMDRHAGSPRFRAIAVLSSGPGAGAAGEVIAFTYGFHGTDGQWWHDLVSDALAAADGEEMARAWLEDSFEVAEVHVHPDHQRHGIGRRMLLRLLDGRQERTALLSTMDTDSTARRLYRRLGFSDLLTGFRFPGADPPYAVMGATLPLRGSTPDGEAPSPHGRWPGPLPDSPSC